MSFNRAKKPYSRPASRPRGSDGEWLHDKAPGSTAASASLQANSAAAGSTAKLMVSNLHYELTPKDLTQIFGDAGTLVREPLIRYDRSGRSSGVAIITYETPEEAVHAKQRFDGKLAKGQPMTIVFYVPAPQRPRPGRTASAPSSLMDRIQKPPLLERLGGKEGKTKAPAPPAPSTKPGLGPIRTKARGGARVPKKPKTAVELDMEIDTFMKSDLSAQGPPPPAPVAPATVEGDVEMT